MKKVLLLFICQISLLLNAQSIQGTLQDEAGEAMPYATLQLLKSDSSIQKIEMTKTDGSFQFFNLKTEVYYLSISFNRL